MANKAKHNRHYLIMLCLLASELPCQAIDKQLTLKVFILGKQNEIYKAEVESIVRKVQSIFSNQLNGLCKMTLKFESPKEVPGYLREPAAPHPEIPFEMSSNFIKQRDGLFALGTESTNQITKAIFIVGNLKMCLNTADKQKVDAWRDNFYGCSQFSANTSLVAIMDDDSELVRIGSRHEKEEWVKNQSIIWAHEIGHLMGLVDRCESLDTQETAQPLMYYRTGKRNLLLSQAERISLCGANNRAPERVCVN